MKKPKKPGDNISLKTKKNESPIILEWINSQTNLMDSIRYLIENEVMANGVRNLQNHIPAERVISIHSKAASHYPQIELHSEEVAVTQEKPELEQMNTVKAEPSPSSFVVEKKEGHEQAEEDGIDEDDIDSWL